MNLRAQAFDERFEQSRMQQMLRFRKAAQARVARSDFLLHALQLRGRTDPAQRGDHGIDQREQEEAEIIGARQAASGIGPGRVERETLQQRAEAGAKIGDELPLLEILFAEVRRKPSHAPMKSEVPPSYQLQMRDRTTTKP